jgi:tetratricopeptide (TPR) repeat protein
VSELDPPLSGLLEEYRNFASRAAAASSIGHEAVDLVFAASPPHMRPVLQPLAIPHWFDRRMVSELASPEATVDEVLSWLAALPFVRQHPRGYAYHDEVRFALRSAMIGHEPDRYRRVSRLLDRAIAAGNEADNEAKRERIFLSLAFDEPAGMERLQSAIAEARSRREVNVTDILVHLAEEQKQLLTRQGRARVEYYRALLSSDMRAWEDGISLFADLNYADLPADVAARAKLYWGLCLEKSGQYGDAIALYEHTLTELQQPDRDPQAWARTHQRLAEVHLELRQLDKAERHCRLSLETNRAQGNVYGEALNLLTLGAVRECLHDAVAARTLLEQSRQKFELAGKPAEVARVWNEIGAVALMAADWEHAERALDSAQRIKEELGDHYGLAFIYANQAKLAIGAGREPASALRLLRVSLELFQQFRDRFNASKVLRNMALINENQADLTGALENMRAAYDAMPPDSAMKPLYQREYQRLQSKAESADGSP